jgi:hypothetical protein
VLDRFAAADEQVIRLRDLIGRQARHLTRLVEDYLDVARLRHGKLALRRQPVDLREIVRHALDAVAAAGEAALTTFVRACPRPPSWCTVMRPGWSRSCATCSTTP